MEILNYKSNDFINYGELESIDVLSPGFGYDIISPPTVTIEDPVGTGAEGFVSLSGSLSEIRVIDSGFDYEETPTVNILGGNGSGAKAFANMGLIDHSSLFNSSTQIQLGQSQSNITFSNPHKFRNSEEVIYSADNQTSIEGLTDQESYLSLIHI